MIRYLVTTHSGLPGARLSRPGIWGNLPYDTIEEAKAAAKEDAGAAPFAVEMQHVTPKKRKLS